MRSVDLFYAAAIGVLFVWLVLGASNGPPNRALAPVSAPSADTAATLTTPPALDSPRVAASATIDARQFEILVGEGPPAWSVAVSVDD